jgi:hypothetical protein
MSSGDLLFIFTFLILPTIILVSCIWLYILLRKGVLLPPARMIQVSADDADDMEAPESASDALVEEPTSGAPVIVSSTVSVGSGETSSAPDQTVQIATASVEGDHEGIETVDAPADPDTASAMGIEAAPEPTPADVSDDTAGVPAAAETAISDAEPESASFAPESTLDTGTEAFPLVTAVSPTVAETPEAVSDAEEPAIADDESRVAATSELAADAIESNPDEISPTPLAEPVGPTSPPEVNATDAAVVDAPPEDDVDDAIEITDEHPIVDIAPAATSAVLDDRGDASAMPHSNGVSEPHPPRTAARRKDIRRPVAQLRRVDESPGRARLNPAAFRKGSRRG